MHRQTDAHDHSRDSIFHIKGIFSSCNMSHFHFIIKLWKTSHTPILYFTHIKLVSEVKVSKVYWKFIYRDYRKHLLRDLWHQPEIASGILLWTNQNPEICDIIQRLPQAFEYNQSESRNRSIARHDYP